MKKFYTRTEKKIKNLVKKSKSIIQRTVRIKQKLTRRYEIHRSRAKLEAMKLHLKVGQFKAGKLEIRNRSLCMFNRLSIILGSIFSQMNESISMKHILIKKFTSKRSPE